MRRFGIVSSQMGKEAFVSIHREESAHSSTYSPERLLQPRAEDAAKIYY
jgi:hypothetical protein